MAKNNGINMIVVLLAAALIFWFCISRNSNQQEQFDENDKEQGINALNDLEHMIKNNVPILNVSEKELERIKDDIYIAKIPEESTTERLEYFPEENTRYWPYYYYSFPYNEKAGSRFPPGMYSRLYYWSPGFYTGSGWSYYMRPGMGYKYWPRNRWIRNTKNGKNNYYFVTNRDDYIHSGTADYSQLPLDFSS